MISRRQITLLAILAANGFGVTASVAGDVDGTVSVDGMKSAASIVIYVDGIPEGHFNPPAEHAAIHQKRMTFLPHVLPVMQGTTVDFYNDDPLNHGVSWPSVSGNKKLSHHLGIWPQGEMRSFTFSDPGVVPLLCYLHPEMSGFVIVLPTPYFAVTDEGGRFCLKGVPAGDRVVKFWSEEGEPATVPVHIDETGTQLTVTIHHAHTR